MIPLGRKLARPTEEDQGFTNQIQTHPRMTMIDQAYPS